MINVIQLRDFSTIHAELTRLHGNGNEDNYRRSIQNMMAWIDTALLEAHNMKTNIEFASLWSQFEALCRLVITTMRDPARNLRSKSASLKLLEHLCKQVLEEDKLDVDEESENPDNPVVAQLWFHLRVLLPTTIINVLAESQYKAFTVSVGTGVPNFFDGSFNALGYDAAQIQKRIDEIQAFNEEVIQLATRFLEKEQQPIVAAINALNAIDPLI